MKSHRGVLESSLFNCITQSAAMHMNAAKVHKSNFDCDENVEFVYVSSDKFAQHSSDNEIKLCQI